MTQRSLWLRNNIYVLGIISALLFGLETGAVSPVFAETQDQGPAADEDAIPVEKIYNESRTQEPKEKITQPVEPASSSGETDEPEPKGKLDKGLIVNGDIVEYSTDTSAISASGNVVVVYGEATLTCDKLTGNSATKDVEAEGNVRLDDKRGVILGSRMTYNFQAQTGTLYDAGFRANPYFGRAEK